MHLYFVRVTPAEPQPRPGVGQDERIWLLAGQSASEGGQPGGRTLLWPPAPEVSTASRRITFLFVSCHDIRLSL